jgi:hypothetical protein
MNKTEHKQYLIDSIVGKLYEGRETLSEQAVKTYQDIIERKEANIAEFQRLLNTIQ